VRSEQRLAVRTTKPICQNKGFTWLVIQQSRGRVIIPPPRGSLAHFLSEISGAKKIDLKNI